MTLRKIGPGVYVDSEGALHLDLVELCAAAGVPPTAENQQRLADTAVAMIANDAGAALVDYADDGGGAWRDG